MRQNIVNVLDFGAKGDGISDDTKAFQDALDSGTFLKVLIPYGTYKISDTLRVSSYTEITAHPLATVFIEGNTQRKRGDFLLSNKDIVSGNIDISIRGGIWDGNNKSQNNKKGGLFDVNGFSGTTLNFVNVKNLTIESLRIKDSVAFNIRMSVVEDFHINNIEFYSERLNPNQDGIHLGGFVKNGIIENIIGLSCGQTNDDLIALNADDCVERVDNFDLKRGPIENIVIRNIYAEDCHSAIRMLSISQPIRNIHISDVQCGCRANAINMDAARYTITPLFKEEEMENGVGAIENITIKNFNVYKSKPNNLPLLSVEENLSNFKIIDFNRDFKRDAAPQAPTLAVKNITDTKITMEQIDKKYTEMASDFVKEMQEYKDLFGEECTDAVFSIKEKSDKFTYAGNFTNLIIN